jgi:acetylornithine deacetylase
VKEILECLDRLVGFPTISRETNLPLIEYISLYLKQLDLPVRVFHNAERTKASLYSTIGPAREGGVILSGHTDVVPVEGQDWSSDPFRLVRREDRFFARGAADMKGFLACVLSLAKIAATRSLQRPLHMAMSYDEEIGCVGVRPMLRQLQSSLMTPALVIVGEPTQMQTAVAHKGKIAARVRCVGHACHSSQSPHGLNAIYLATDMIQELRGLQSEIIRNGTTDEAFAVPFTTLHVGTIHGGTALNIVPSQCTVEFEIRNLPADDPKVLLDRLQQRAVEKNARCRRAFRDSGINIEVFNDYPGLQAEEDAMMVRQAAAWSDGLAARKLDFGTEAGLFDQSLRVPVVICGPGNINDAHKRDEFVTLDQLRKCDRMLRHVLTWLEH